MVPASQLLGLIAKTNKTHFYIISFLYYNVSGLALYLKNTQKSIHKQDLTKTTTADLTY